MEERINCILKKLSNNSNALRTNEVVGYCFEQPEINKPFHMFAKPIDPTASVRMVVTSLVKEIEWLQSNNKIYRLEFKTLNSVYSLDIVSKDPNGS